MRARSANWGELGLGSELGRGGSRYVIRGLGSRLAVGKEISCTKTGEALRYNLVRTKTTWEAEKTKPSSAASSPRENGCNPFFKFLAQGHRPRWLARSVRGECRKTFRRGGQKRGQLVQRLRTGG